MSQQPPSSEPSPMQFDQAEYASAGPGASPCAGCNKTPSDTYFSVNGKVVCPACKDQLIAAFNGGSGTSRLLRATLFGLGAAIVCSGIWYAVARVTNAEWGILAIGVGWLVGRAVNRGSDARGGRLYQLVAVLLTYMSIASANIPYVIEAINRDPDTLLPSDGEAPAPNAAPADNAAAAPEETPPAAGGDDEMHGLASVTGFPAMLLAFALIFALALAAPFLGGFSNIFGIIIIGVGLWEAWRVNARLQIDIAGPFKLAAPSSGGVSAA